MNIKEMLCRALFGLPAFRFNKELFNQIIREQENGARIDAPDSEPEVKFEYGELEGSIIGEFDKEESLIRIDVLKVFFTCVNSRKKPLSVEDLKQRFDDKLTHALAHEGGHWRLEKCCGRRAQLDKMVIHFGFLAVGFLMLLLLLTFVVSNETAIDIARTLFVWRGISGVLRVFAVVIIWFVVISRVARGFIWLWSVAASAVTYQLCYSERYARRYAREAGKDGRWKGVIEVD